MVSRDPGRRDGVTVLLEDREPSSWMGGRGSFCVAGIGFEAGSLVSRGVRDAFGLVREFSTSNRFSDSHPGIPVPPSPSSSSNISVNLLVR